MAALYNPPCRTFVSHSLLFWPFHTFVQEWVSLGTFFVKMSAEQIKAKLEREQNLLTTQIENARKEMKNNTALLQCIVPSNEVDEGHANFVLQTTSSSRTAR